MHNCDESPGAAGNGVDVRDKGSCVRWREVSSEQGNCNHDPRDVDNTGVIVPFVEGQLSPRNSHGKEYTTPIKTVETIETVVASNHISVVSYVEEPKVGMVFNSWRDVEVYYKEYAEQIGFGVSRVQGAYSRGEVRERISTTWRCECYGKPDMRAQREAKKRAKAMGFGGSGGVVGRVVVEDDLSRSKRRSNKCECGAMVYASANREGQWVIKKVNLEHSSHTPNPTMAKLVKEYRMKKYTSRARKNLFNFFDQGVSVSQIHGCMATEVGGSENLALTVKDLQHEVYKKRRLQMEGGDSVAMMSYFQQMQSRNQIFYQTQRLDEDGRLKDVLWVDPRSRAAYEEFGEIVCFDATYLTNKYALPFANFVGVNHHGQTILLGCALVSREDSDTFRWVFKQWLECMNDKPPLTILTDQAPAMRKPLEEIMPNTRHRWCIWHIMRKIPDKLGKCGRYKQIKRMLKSVVYESFTIQEFENRWLGLVANFKLESNEWLNTLYNERHMWVPAFMKEYFWAGMKTTQRVESINSFFDGFLNKNTQLYEFPVKYDSALRKRVGDETDADAKCSKYIRRIVTGFNVEKFFQKIYTDTKFQEVQNECIRMMYCVPRQENKVSDVLVQYLIEDRVWIVPDGKSEDVLTDKRRLYSATFNTETKVVCCECRKFETDGIMCRHTIRIFDLNHVKDIPDRYILSRWRKDILRKHTRVRVSYHDPDKTAEVQRYTTMINAFEPICDEAAMVDDVTVQMVIKSLEKIKSQVSECRRKKLAQTVPMVYQEDGSQAVHHTPEGNHSKSAGPQQPGASDGMTDDVLFPEAIVKDPVTKKRGRGRPKVTRYKGLSEIGYKKPMKTPPPKKKTREDVPTKKPRKQPVPTKMPRKQSATTRKPTKEQVRKVQHNKKPIPRKRKSLEENLGNPPSSIQQPLPKKQKIGGGKRKQPARRRERSNRSSTNLDWLNEKDSLLVGCSIGISENDSETEIGPPNAKNKQKRKQAISNVSPTNSVWLDEDDNMLVDCSIDLSETIVKSRTHQFSTSTNPPKSKTLGSRSSANLDWMADVESLLKDRSITLCATATDIGISSSSYYLNNLNKKARSTTSSSNLDWLDDDDSLLVDCSIDLSETL